MIIPAKILAALALAGLVLHAAGGDIPAQQPK